MRSEFFGTNLETTAKTAAISAGFQSILGSAPVTSYTETQGIITFTPEQASILRDYISNKMKGSNTPPDLKIDLLPVVLPLILEKALPVVAGILILGFILGRKGRKK